MSFKKYILSKVPFLMINLTIYLILMIIMIIIGINIRTRFFMFLIWFSPLISYLVLEYFNKKNFYDDVIGILESLDKKYLLPEIVKKPSVYEEQVTYEVLRECCREMHEHVNYYKNLQGEYREYIETWVHEIKTPIASLSLIAENSDSKNKRALEDELNKIEIYIEQVLYYSRSTDVSTDYIVKEFEIKNILQRVIRKNRRDFISKGFSIDIDNVFGKVITDSKWIEFIINQIIVNSIKYSNKESAKFKAYTKINEDNIILFLEDNGIGISDKDIKRVFDKGFTGENGRVYGKSTGIGLYLCKKLCAKLGLGIEIESKINKGTKVKIVFPKGSHNLIE